MRRLRSRIRCVAPAIVLALACVAGEARAESDSMCFADLVCLEMDWNQDHAVLTARNRLDVPAGVRIEFQRLVGVTAVPRLRDGRVALSVVPPGRVKQLLVLVRDDVRTRPSAPFRWSISYGDPTAKHDDTVVYRMPFGGQEGRPLTQGANGRFTHRGRSAWSFDFGMPVGTPILAARAGRVVEINDGYTRSGITDDFLDKANAVTVLHDDGTFATYAHLDPGAGVREGMRVAVGDVLGFSGNTGFSTGPHLHFSVWRPTFEGGLTVPVRFGDAAGIELALVEGRIYRPTCHAEGRPCQEGELPAAPAAAPTAGPTKQADGTCRCRNGSVITTRLPCRAVCP